MAFGQIAFHNYPRLTNYIDAVEWFESVKPLSKGKWKGLVPFARRGDIYQWMEKNGETIDIYLETTPCNTVSPSFDKIRPSISFYSDGHVKIGYGSLPQTSRKTPYLSKAVAELVAHILRGSKWACELGWSYVDQPYIMHYRQRNYPTYKHYFSEANIGQWTFDKEGNCLNPWAGFTWAVDKDKKREVTKKYAGLFEYIRTVTILTQIKDEGRAWDKTVVSDEHVYSALRKHKDIIPKLADPNAFELHAKFVTDVLKDWEQLGSDVSKYPKVLATMLRNIIYRYHAKDFIKEVMIEQYADGSSNKKQIPTKTSYRNKIWLDSKF